LLPEDATNSMSSRLVACLRAGGGPSRVGLVQTKTGSAPRGASVHFVGGPARGRAPRVAEAASASARTAFSQPSHARGSCAAQGASLEKQLLDRQRARRADAHANDHPPLLAGLAGLEVGQLALALYEGGGRVWRIEIRGGRDWRFLGLEVGVRSWTLRVECAFSGCVHSHAQAGARGGAHTNQLRSAHRPASRLPHSHWHGADLRVCQDEARAVHKALALVHVPAVVEHTHEVDVWGSGLGLGAEVCGGWLAARLGAWFAPVTTAGSGLYEATAQVCTGTASAAGPLRQGASETRSGTAKAGAARRRCCRPATRTARRRRCRRRRRGLTRSLGYRANDALPVLGGPDDARHVGPVAGDVRGPLGVFDRLGAQDQSGF
jgi:hypothetical protein